LKKARSESTLRFPRARVSSARFRAGRLVVGAARPFASSKGAFVVSRRTRFRSVQILLGDGARSVFSCRSWARGDNLRGMAR